MSLRSQAPTATHTVNLKCCPVHEWGVQAFESEMLTSDPTKAAQKSEIQTEVCHTAQFTHLLKRCRNGNAPLWQRRTSCIPRIPWKIFTQKIKQNKTLPCSLSVGGWEVSKQFSEHDSCVSCFNSIKMAEQNLAKLSEGEKKKSPFSSEQAW